MTQDKDARIAELAAENERLRNMLNGYGKLDAELAIAERRIESLSRTGAVKVKPAAPEGRQEARELSGNTGELIDKMAEAICGEIKRLRTENEKLREIISHCAASLGNGAAIMPTCTVEFMAELPREIELVTSGLRSELSTAYRRGREDMREDAAKVADARMYDFGCIAGTEAYDFVKICAELAAAIRKLEA